MNKTVSARRIYRFAGEDACGDRFPCSSQPMAGAHIKRVLNAQTFRQFDCEEGNASAAVPDEICTTVPPAKSIAPSVRSQPPSPHTQCATGSYTSVVHDKTNTIQDTKRTRSTTAPKIRVEEDRKLTRPEQELTSEPGTVGKKELPSGIEKTDKQEWGYSDGGIRTGSLWKRITDWGRKG